MGKAVSGFFACGIFLLNPDAILDHEIVHSENLWRKADIFFRGHKNQAITDSTEEPVNSGSLQQRRQKTVALNGRLYQNGSFAKATRTSRAYAKRQLWL